MRLRPASSYRKGRSNRRGTRVYRCFLTSILKIYWSKSYSNYIKVRKCKINLVEFDFGHGLCGSYQGIRKMASFMRNACLCVQNSPYRSSPSTFTKNVVRGKAARWEHPIAKKIFRLFYVPIYTLHLLFLETSSIDTTNYIHILRSNLKTWIWL